MTNGPKTFKNDQQCKKKNRVKKDIEEKNQKLKKTQDKKNPSSVSLDFLFSSLQSIRKNQKIGLPIPKPFLSTPS
jgi:uridine kinase